MARRGGYAASGLVLVLLAGCSLDAPDGGPSSAVDEGVICNVAYRTSVEEPLTPVQTFELGPGSGEEIRAFADLALHLHYTRDEFEGNSLVAFVTPPGSEERLGAQLYQFGEGPVSNFAGDHGFTGLVYQYHPESGSELQYWCAPRDD